MGYLTNRTVNYLNIQSALLTLPDLVWALFVPIHFYSAGFSLPEIFCLYALFNGTRIPLRLLSFPIIARIGLKRALMLGAAGYSLSFPLLGMVQGYDIWLLAYTLAFGLFNALYWHCFHTFYSHAGEHEHRGKQVSISLGLGAAVSALAPLLGGVFLLHHDFQAFFLLTLPVLALMLLVLGRCQDIPLRRTPWREGKALMFNLGARIHLAEASLVFPLHIGWVFVVYLFSQNRIEVFGGILTIGMVAQLLYQLWLGHALDKGAGRRVAHIAGALRLLEVLGKALLPLSLPRIVALEGLTGATNVHHGLAYTTVMYNAGKDSFDPLWYWLFAETAFDLGTILGAVAFALLLWQGIPLQPAILIALPGTLAVWWLTARYFPRRGNRIAPVA